MLKKTFLILSCFSLVIILASFSFEKKQKVLRTIIIDAGHGMRGNGGYDGAKGSYSYEDEICYAVSKKLIKEISKNFPEIRIVETRPGKEIVDLHERARIANANKGDLFISIHVNAAPALTQREFIGNKTVVSYVGKGKKKKKITKTVPQYRTYKVPNPAKGTETFIWGAHKNDDKEVAMRENAPMFNEENYEEKYGSIDPNSPDFIALSLLKTKQFFKRSATLSGMVEEQFVKVGRASRGQQQRPVGIWVLQATAMPSILVETGFISNREEEDYLNSEKGQQEIAECINNAVKNYIAWLEKQGSQNVNMNPTAATEANITSFLEQIDKHDNSK